MKRPTLLVVAMILAAAPHPAAAQSVDDALKALNAAGRGAYAQGRETMAARVSPIILVNFDELILHRDGKIEHAPFTPVVYQRLKSVSHVPLGTVALLAAERPGERTGAWREKLEALGDQARAVGPLLGEAGFTEAQKSRLERILARSLAVIDKALAEGVPTPAALDAYARELGPLLLANATDAARAQIDALHAVVQRWRGQMSAAEWQRLYVVVMGARQPREGNLQFAYFVQAMGRQAVDRRLIYAEGLFTPAAALGLLKTIVVDRKVGEAFFDDPGRMERDLLADAAAEHLLHLFGRLGTE